MEKIVRQAYLYDFYGELLTDHQKRIYEEAVLNDLSPSEIAKEIGISRQGVFDMIRRCDKILNDYENKLHLLERFLKNREKIRKICDLSQEKQEDAAKTLSVIHMIASEIMEESY